MVNFKYVYNTEPQICGKIQVFSQTGSFVSRLVNKSHSGGLNVARLGVP